jgi:hypothetical protein
MRYDDPNVPLSAVLGIVGALILFVIIVLLQALFYQMESAELERKVAGQPDRELARLRAEQQELLSSYGWVDREGGVVHVPIERAMELVAGESRAE